MLPRAHSYPGQSFSKVWGLSNRLAPGKHQIHTTKWVHLTPDRFGEVLLALRLPLKLRLQDLTHLFLHGSPMLGGPNAQPSLQRVIQTPYCNASHASMIALLSTLAIVKIKAYERDS